MVREGTVRGGTRRGLREMGGEGKFRERERETEWVKKTERDED